MNDRELGRVARFGRDILVIIVGVLIALGFDSWSAGIGARRLERDYLARLARDLRADSAMIAAQRRRASVGEAAARELERILAGSGGTVSDSLVGVYFSDATRAAYLALNDPTMVELQMTGNLRVLRDPDLREALLTYYTRVERLQFNIETVMRRGKDPLGDLGWDLRAYDRSLAYAVTLGTTQTGLMPSRPASADDGSLLAAYRAHPEAQLATRRAVTYNAMVQPILIDWELALAEVRRNLE